MGTRARLVMGITSLVGLNVELRLVWASVQCLTLKRSSGTIIFFINYILKAILDFNFYFLIFFKLPLRQNINFFLLFFFLKVLVYLCI